MARDGYAGSHDRARHASDRDDSETFAKPNKDSGDAKLIRRGRKPTPAKLRLVLNAHRPARHDVAEPRFASPTKPASMRGQAAKAWAKYIAPATWLDITREPAAIAFCELWAEFTERPVDFLASKHGQMRAYMGELGLTDERNRPAAGDGERDEFFED
jgi:hypothetical protein